MLVQTLLNLLLCTLFVPQISPEDVPKAVNDALDAGYRLIDEALIYNNEKAVGDALKQRFLSGKTKREDVFVTSKVVICRFITN